MLVNMLNLRNNHLKCLASVANEFDARTNLIARGDNQRLDFFCRSRGALGEFANFLRDNVLSAEENGLGRQSFSVRQHAHAA